MAAPIAYEQPTVNSAWRAFLDHLPTLALVLACQVGVAIICLLVVFMVIFVSTLLLGTAVMGSSDQPSLIALIISNLGQLPFIIISNMIGVLVMAVPAMHYESGLTITPGMAFGALWRRPLRYLLAGLLFGVVSSAGFLLFLLYVLRFGVEVAIPAGILLCILPAVVVALVMPVYVNRIFNTNKPILEAFTGSFQAVYQSERGMTFVGIQLLTVLVATVLTVCSCGVGLLVVIPMAMFYVQNAAYRQGVLR